MLKFVLNTLIMLSLGAILYLVAKTLPRIDDRSENKDDTLKAHWLMSYLEKTDAWLKSQLEKILRRSKVWILKLDNYVSERLGKFKKDVPPAKSFAEEEGKPNPSVENNNTST